MPNCSSVTVRALHGVLGDCRLAVRVGGVLSALAGTAILLLSLGVRPAMASVPGPVKSLTATPGANQAKVQWTAPSTGGAPTSYVITALSGGTLARNTTAIPSASTSTTISGLTGGTAYKFSVYGANAEGNGSSTSSSSITPTGITTPYTSAVLADSPTFYYRLDETAATTALDSSGNVKTGTEVGAPSQGSAGLLTTDADTGLALNGSSQYVYSNASYANPNPFTIEAWFKTTTTTGGQIVGFGNLQTGESSPNDRHLYMANNGELIFGVYPGEVKSINSTTTYKDGKPHYVVATLSSAGMFLYVDGGLVASNATVTSAQSYTGYWRIGYDSLFNWPSAPTSYYFKGTIDEAAVYPTALSLQRVQVHYCDGASVNCLSMTAPSTASFTLLTLNGLNQTKTVAVPFEVTDNTGGNGWSIAATSTTFKSGSNTLPTTATTVTSAPSSACAGGFTCTAPTNSVSYPYTLPAAATAPTETKLVNAQVGSGTGHQTITPTFSLAAPAAAHAGAYTSTWTFTLSSGP
jgi:Concanavalin A-like lectin/glucanases superfamily/Fibronectin type III domain